MLTGSAAAQAQIYKAVLSGANEVPAVTTNGSGISVVSLNTTTYELRVKTTFSGLTGNVTASHIHCCIAPGTNAGVATQTPTFAGFPSGVTAGSYDATFDTTLAPTWNATFINANGGTPAGAEAAFSTGLNNGRNYLNIHTSTSLGGEIRANLVRFSFVPASNTATASLAAALDSLGAGTGAVNERLVSMAMLNDTQQSVALEVLLPAPASVVAATLSNSLYADYDQISNRLAGLRGDAENGVWIRYADRQNDYTLSRRNADAESDGWDVSAGIDSRMAAGWLLGASLSYSEDSLDYGGGMLGSTGDLEGWRATVYTETALGGGFLEGMVTIAQNDSESVRNLGTINGLALANGESDLWGARLAVGTDLEMGTGVTATPQLRLDWSNLDIDGYQESASGGLGLTVGSQDVDSLRLSVGGQVDWNTSSSFKPFVRGFWIAELENDDIVTMANFTAGGTAFTATDAGPESSGFTLGVGLNFASSDSFGASISYDLTDNDSFESNLLQARALWRF